MTEKEMGNRGTKSKLNLNFVKAQRVDGRWYESKTSYQRCTLKDFERNYQFRIPSCGFDPGATSKLWSCSNQQSIGGFSKFYSTVSNCNKNKPSIAVLKGGKKQTREDKGILNPWFVTGFSDAEGCFHLSISQNSSLKTGWEVRLNFQIGLHIKDLDLLKLFKLYFGVGLVFTRGSMVYFRVRSIKDLHIIFNHFNNYPLKTQKWADFPGPPAQVSWGPSA